MILRPRFDQDLPILARRLEIEQAIRDHQVIIICGQTGSGKTTQLPQIALAAGRGTHGLIGHTQPRRLAARSVAARIADELGVSLGGPVGVKVRFNDQTSRSTVIKLLTDGMLLAEISSDPRLLAYDTIIIDEAHERSLNVDFLLGYLKRLLPDRPDLKLIITSATIDPKRFSAHFGSESIAPIIEVSGRMFPVEIRYRGSVRESDTIEQSDAVASSAVVDAIEELCSPQLAEGDVLVFLPGEREIRQCAQALSRARIDADVLPLFSRLTNTEQDRIFRVGPRRRVILSTNVAETSLTVPGIRYVVDTGLARLNRYDPRSKVQRLLIEPISKSSADQRAGRCGRVAAGICIRLYSERSFRDRPSFTDPEIHRSNLSSVILRMLSLGFGRIQDFPFLDPPDARAVRDAYETLFELGAIDASDQNAQITPIGRRMSQLPIEPRVARMLIAGQEHCCLHHVLVLAAFLSIQDPRERPMDRADAADQAQTVFRDEHSDFLTVLNIWDQYQHAADTFSSSELRDWCRQHFLNASRMREWVDTQAQLREICEELDLDAQPASAESESIHRAVMTGLIANLMCRDDNISSRQYNGPHCKNVNIFPGSVLFKACPKWIVAGEIVETTRVYARLVAAVEPDWIEQLASHMLQRSLSSEHFDKDLQKAVAFERITIAGLVVVPRRSIDLADANPALARELFIHNCLVQGDIQPTESAPPIACQTIEHIRHLHTQQRSVRAKLRRHDITQTPQVLFQRFSQLLPQNIIDTRTFEHWLTDSDEHATIFLSLSLTDLLHLLSPSLSPQPKNIPTLNDLNRLYPDEISILTTRKSVEKLPVHYAFSPGKDDDGVTLSIPLLSLDSLTQSHIDWSIPGLFHDKIFTLLKQLPKQIRAEIESHIPLDPLAHQCAELLTPSTDQATCPSEAKSFPQALSEAVEIITEIHVDPERWPLNALPAHLLPRLSILDSSNIQIASGRNLQTLQRQFASRIAKAKADAARLSFNRTGITTWDFGDLPQSIQPQDDPDQVASSFPALLDNTDSIELTLVSNPRLAAELTHRSIRRLFALAAREELTHRIRTLPQWEDLCKFYSPLGSRDQLLDETTCIIAERVFMTAQPPVTTHDQFEARKIEQWGRLAQASFEVGELLYKILEPRHRIASRLASGTNRLWIASIADMREHAAYLMPRSFLLYVPADKLRDYPRYSAALRQRLLNLREDGSGAESDALRLFLPHWKKLTAAIAQLMSNARAAGESPDPASNLPKSNRKTAAALPQNRRTAAIVNVDAGEWAIFPGNLPEPLAAYRWALEDARTIVFAADASFKPGTPATAALAKLEQLWTRVDPSHSSRR